MDKSVLLSNFAVQLYVMKQILLCLIGVTLMLSSCKHYNNVMKTSDYEYKYEAAKEYFVKGEYAKAAVILADVVTILKGTMRAEESLYMLAMSEYCDGNYDISHSYFKKYYQTYPKGVYVEYARYYAGCSLYESVPDTRLDQSNVSAAIMEFQDFLDFYPYTKLREKAQNMIFALQDKMVEKEFQAARLYLDLGSYMGNCAYGGSNYEACIVTSRNALLDFPYASPERREQFSFMILKAKYQLAVQSVESKRMERYRDTIDEYYGFVNEYPESKNLKEAKRIFEASNKIVNKKQEQLSK